MIKHFPELFEGQINRSYEKLVQLKNGSAGNILAVNAFNKMVNRLNKSLSGEKITFSLLDLWNPVTFGDLRKSLCTHFAEGIIDHFQIASCTQDILPLLRFYSNGDDTIKENKLYYSLFDSNPRYTTIGFSYNATQKDFSLEDLLMNRLHVEKVNVFESEECFVERKKQILTELNPNISLPIKPFKSNNHLVIPLNKQTEEIFQILKDAEIYAINNYLSLEASKAIKEHYKQI